MFWRLGIQVWTTHSKQVPVTERVLLTRKHEALQSDDTADVLIRQVRRSKVVFVLGTEIMNTFGKQLLEGFNLVTSNKKEKDSGFVILFLVI